MEKLFLLFSFCLLLIISFTEDQYMVTFSSSDSLVTFKVKDHTKKANLQEIKEEILKTYDYIMYETITTAYQPPSTITIHLYEGKKRSYALKKEIHLYAFKNYSYVLAHELTHVLVGYNFYQEIHIGMLTQEGFAEYVQHQVGLDDNLNYDISPHKHAHYFLLENKLSSLHNLIYDENLMKLVTNPTNDQTSSAIDSFRIWKFYVEAASFTSFLIDQYGFSLFEQVYNQPDLLELLPNIYQKSINELEVEWREYILHQIYHYSPQEIKHPTVRSIQYFLQKI